MLARHYMDSNANFIFPLDIFTYLSYQVKYKMLDEVMEDMQIFVIFSTLTLMYKYLWRGNDNRRNP